MTNKDVNAVLRAVVDRSVSQKELRIANIRAELAGLGMSIVSTEWLKAVTKDLRCARVRTSA